MRRILSRAPVWAFGRVNIDKMSRAPWNLVVNLNSKSTAVGSDPEFLSFGPRMKVRQTDRVGFLVDLMAGPTYKDFEYILEFSNGQVFSYRRDEVDYAI